jgi:hypothetical protein
MTAPTTTAQIPGQQSSQIRSDVANWADLSRAIDEHNGVALVPMETLRRLEGAQRLGVHVLKSIGARLGTLGLGHMPEELPNRQDQEAIVYRYGTPASDVIHAVKVGPQNQRDVYSTYRALHKLNSYPEPEQVVHREILDDNLATAAQAVLDLLGDERRMKLLGGLTDRGSK